MTGWFHFDGALEDSCYVTDHIGRVRAEGFADVQFVVVEQAQVKFAVGRQAHPVAGAAVGLADRADEPHDAARTRELIVARFVGEVFRWEFGERAEGRLDSAARFDVRDVALHRQRRAFSAAQRHQLDKSHVPVALDGQARELDDVGFVVAGGYDRVELYRRESRFFRRDYPAPDFLEAAPSHLPFDGRRVQAIEMHIDTIQARAFKCRREVSQQESIGGQREAVHAGNASEAFDDLDQIEPQRRLAAGQPEFSKAHAHRGTRDGFELDRRQQFVLGEKAQAFQRHAVNASQVACVDYRQPQVIYLTIERVAGHNPIVIPADRAKQLSADETLNLANSCAASIIIDIVMNKAGT